MTQIQSGPVNLWGNLSLGELFYNELNFGNRNRIIAIEQKTGKEVTADLLLSASISLARYLQNEGVTNEDIIAIITENTWKYYVVLTAGLFLGVPVYAINPDYNSNEFDHYLRLTDPSFIFVSSRCLPKLSIYASENQKYETILIDDIIHDTFQNLDTIISKNSNQKQEFEVKKLDVNKTVALILLSSGTSGLPKAVMITHNNLRNCIGYMRDPRFLKCDENTRTIAVLPMFHIFGLIINFPCIVNKSMSVLLNGFKPDEFLKTIEDYKITHLYVVPSLMGFLAKTPLLDQFDVTSVKKIVCGAAPLGKELEKIVQDRFVNADVIQIYGLTEMGGAVSMTNDDTRHKKGCSGSPVYGVSIKITDVKTGCILPFGSQGEVCVKGDGTMKGYYRNEEATREVFDQDGFMKTGDLGYFDEDGALFIVDRLKEVIKYKGFQVSPAELEDLLKKHKSVNEVAVVGKPDERAGEVPVAFIVKQPNSKVTEEDLVNFVSEQVSFQKRLHGGIIFTDKLPKNSTGKLLRRELRDKLRQM